MAVPFASAALTHWSGHGPLAAALQSQWRHADWLITAIVVTAGCVLLVAIVRGGGARHRDAYDRWMRHGQPSQASIGEQGLASDSPGCTRGFLGALARPYAWRMRRLLARAESPVMARVLLGMGPATHWTTRLFEASCTLVFAGALATLALPFMSDEARARACAWGAMFVLILLSPPAVQQLHRVRQTRREQALLALLPGVPRGPVLNRWLGWQASWPFLATAGLSLAVAGGLAALAEALRPGVVGESLGGMVSGCAVALVPLVALQWRAWARLREPGSLEAIGPVLLQMALVALAVMLHAVWDVGYPTTGIAFALAAAAWCAWRWWRMGGEPTALPMGRLA